MQPDNVIEFWFGEDARPSWFKKSDVFDAKVRAVLGPYYEAARDGQLIQWEDTPEGTLALVLLLDQAPRNMFRDDAKAFATDAKALDIAKRAVEQGFDDQLDRDAKLFLYLPFEHSETDQDQDTSVRLISALDDASYTKYAEQHRDIIARFGRFPHRNVIVGRASTLEETEFLAQPDSSF